MKLKDIDLDRVQKAWDELAVVPSADERPVAIALPSGLLHVVRTLADSLDPSNPFRVEQFIISAISLLVAVRTEEIYQREPGLRKIRGEFEKFSKLQKLRTQMADGKKFIDAETIKDICGISCDSCDHRKGCPMDQTSDELGIKAGVN